MNGNGGLSRRTKKGVSRPVKPAEPNPARHHKTTYRERRWAR